MQFIHVHDCMRVGILCTFGQLAGWNKSCFVYCLNLVESHPSRLDITTECVNGLLHIKIRSTGKLLVFGWEKEISGHCVCGNLCMQLALCLLGVKCSVENDHFLS